MTDIAHFPRPGQNYPYVHLSKLLSLTSFWVRFVRIWLRCRLYGEDWHHTQKLVALLLLTTAGAEKAKEVLLRRNDKSWTKDSKTHSGQKDKRLTLGCKPQSPPGREQWPASCTSARRSSQRGCRARPASCPGPWQPPSGHGQGHQRSKPGKIIHLRGNTLRASISRFYVISCAKVNCMTTFTCLSTSWIASLMPMGPAASTGAALGTSPSTSDMLGSSIVPNTANIQSQMLTTLYLRHPHICIMIWLTQFPKMETVLILSICANLQWLDF